MCSTSVYSFVYRTQIVSFIIFDIRVTLLNVRSLLHCWQLQFFASYKWLSNMFESFPFGTKLMFSHIEPSNLMQKICALDFIAF